MFQVPDLSGQYDKYIGGGHDLNTSRTTISEFLKQTFRSAHSSSNFAPRQVDIHKVPHSFHERVMINRLWIAMMGST